MKTLAHWTLSAGLAMTTCLAGAQPPRSNTAYCGPANAASAASDCPMRRGHGPADHSDIENTSGWSMMSRSEQQEHRDKLHSFKTYEECKSYMDQHHEQMVTRAKEKGRTMPVQPRRDACAGLMATKK